MIAIAKSKPGTRLVLILLCLFLTSAVFANQVDADDETKRYRSASEYSRQKRGLAVLIVKNGRVVFEDYQNGHSSDMPHRLASGTKSFSGIILAAAIDDGLIKNADELVADTITEWRSDERKSRISIRQLLSLTSGIDAGRIGGPPPYSKAIGYQSRFEPGSRFQYGPVPFQIFGEVMRRKLKSKNESVLQYLKRRILNQIGLNVSRWRTQCGQPNMPSGAFLTARDWAKYGRFLLNRGKWGERQIVNKGLFEMLTKGSKANPNYGISFWLNRSSNGNAKIAQSGSGRAIRFRRLLNIRPETERISRDGIGKDLPRSIYLAAGAGKQRLYMIPGKEMVVVRQGRQSQFSDHEFLSRLLNGK